MSVNTSVSGIAYRYVFSYNNQSAIFLTKKCANIRVFQKKAVLLHREMNEGTRKGSLDCVK